MAHRRARRPRRLVVYAEVRAPDRFDSDHVLLRQRALAGTTDNLLDLFTAREAAQNDAHAGEREVEPDRGLGEIMLVRLAIGVQLLRQEAKGLRFPLARLRC